MTFVKETLAKGIDLYLGDCRDVLATLKRIDGSAVISDPPYGINFQYNSHDDDPEKWFDLMNIVVPEMRRVSPFVIIPCCQIAKLGWWYKNHEPDWLICWHKGSPGHRAAIGFNDWEPHLVWGTPPSPMHDYFLLVPMITEVIDHPCPKPVGYTDWLINRATIEGGTVIEPFMGSGTTGISAVQLGRKFIGIEKDPKYFDVSRTRIMKALQQPMLFTDIPEIE